uniref:LAG1 longevity assurance 2 n=1 Tax=Anthurium amnicola TaxID=1678845 RepID=A0A1D1YSZ3_9ARAE
MPGATWGAIWGGGGVGVPDPRDFVLVIYFALGFVLLRFLLDVLIYQRLALRLLGGGASLLKIDEAKRAKVAKCSESMWKLTYYVSVQLWALAIIYLEPWSGDTKQYFKGWPNQELKFLLKLFYMCQCGFYTYSIAALLTWETRRKDFSIMMSHHIVTTVLIGYSYFTRFFRIGSIVLALHDASDVFLEAAKLFKYSEREMGASVCFGLFALSWVSLRLIFFPFWIIKISSFYCIEDLSSSEHFTTLYYSFNTMLLTLLVFHVYWWVLICSMILRQMKNRGKVGEDIRSDSEDGD